MHQCDVVSDRINSSYPWVQSIHIMRVCRSGICRLMCLRAPLHLCESMKLQHMKSFGHIHWEKPLCHFLISHVFLLFNFSFHIKASKMKTNVLWDNFAPQEPPSGASIRMRSSWIISRFELKVLKCCFWIRSQSFFVSLSDTSLLVRGKHRSTLQTSVSKRNNRVTYWTYDANKQNNRVHEYGCRGAKNHFSQHGLSQYILCNSFTACLSLYADLRKAVWIYSNQTSQALFTLSRSQKLRTLVWML